MRELLAPLQRLANLMELQNDKIAEIHSVITLDLKKAASDNHAELKKQTSLLVDIKSILTEQLEFTKALKEEQDQPKEIVIGRRRKMTGVAVVTMAGAILLASYAIAQIPEVKSTQLFTALAVAGISLILTEIFVAIETAFERKVGRILADKFTGQKKQNMFMYALASGTAMITMALTVLATAFVFSLIPMVSLAKLSTALAISIVMIPISFAVTGILYGLRRSGLGANKESLKKIAILPLIMSGIALGLVATAWIFKLMPSEIPAGPPPEWALNVGILMASFTFALGMIIKASKKVGINKVIAIATLGLPAIALGIVLLAKILTYLPEDTGWKYVPLLWVANSAAAVLIMGIAIGILGIVAKLHKRTPKELLFTALGAAAIALSIVAVAWIFSYLPETFMAPPRDFSIGAAISLAVFGLPLMLIGFLASKDGGVSLLFGAAGMILIAASMWVVAWIFSTLPDLSAISANFTDAIMYPVNAMLDALVRVKEEIGVSNLLPLAGGLFAIAGGWLALTAALAGQSIGGLISGAANKLADFLNIDMGEGIPGLIDTLAAKKNEIIALGAPMKVLGDAFSVISKGSEGVVTAMASVLPFAKIGRPGRLEKSALAISNIADSYTKIAAASNSMNVDAINASSKMFDAIANLAKADSQDAMKVLAEELMKAVESLSEVVGNLEDTVDNQNTGFENVLEGALNKFKEKIMGSKTTADGNETSFDMSTVVAAIQELESRFDRPISVEDANAF